MPGSARDHRVAELSLLLLTLIWGANFSVVKWALQYFDPLAFNALRFPLASLFILWMVRRSGPLPRVAPGDVVRLLLLGVLGTAVYQLLFIFGVEATRAGNASLLLATTPAWTVLLAALVREGTLDGWVVAGVGATLVGMVLVVTGGHGEVELGGATLRGDILISFGALSWAAYTVLARGLILRYGAIPVTAWTLWSGTATLLVLGAPSLRSAELGAVPIGAWGAVIFAGVLAIGVSYLVWYRGVEVLGSARTAVFGNLVPVVALAVAWAFLGEVPLPLQIAGAAVILGGVFMARYGARWKARHR